jgi:hypothetical protein
VGSAVAAVAPDETGAESRETGCGAATTSLAGGASGAFGAGVTFFAPDAAGSGIDIVATIGTAPKGTGDWSTNRNATNAIATATSTKAPSITTTRPFDGGGMA